jgi:hypothetical protein
MDAFSYLSVLLSIIIGLAITQVLLGYRAILLGGRNVRLDATALIWSFLLIVLATQAWWSSFELRGQAEWDFLSFAVVLLQMILLYMMAGVILPDIGKDEATDLALHFHGHRRAFFGFMAAMLVTSVAKELLISGSLPAPSNLLFHGLGLATACAGSIIASRRVQLWLAIAAALTITTYVALLFARI